MTPLIDSLSKEDQSSSSSGQFEAADFLPNIVETSSSTVQQISDKNFNEIINSDSKGLKIILFTAKWCSPGIAMERNLRMSSVTEQTLVNNKKLNVIEPTEFYSVDTDSNPESCYTYNVRSIPCTLIFKNSEVVAEIVGTVPSSVIADQINKHSANTDDENNSFWNSQDLNDHSYQ